MASGAPTGEEVATPCISAMLDLDSGPKATAESPATNVVALGRAWDILRSSQCLSAQHSPSLILGQNDVTPRCPPLDQFGSMKAGSVGPMFASDF